MPVIRNQPTSVISGGRVAGSLKVEGDLTVDGDFIPATGSITESEITFNTSTGHDHDGSNSKNPVSGAIVGTTDAQILTNKTIDGDDNTVQDLPLTAIKTVIGDADKFIERDGSGIPVSGKDVPSGDVVGTSDTQILTNKTMTENQVTYSGSGHGHTGTTDGKLLAANSVIGSGSYSGNNSANRAIAHGLGVTPKVVMIVIAGGGSHRGIIKAGEIFLMNLSVDVVYVVTTWDSTNFYVGNASNFGQSSNGTGSTYHWVAIGA